MKARLGDHFNIAVVDVAVPCPGDCGDGEITIDELIAAVCRVLDGCSAPG